MATITRQVRLDATAADAWDAVRDVGALPTRLARGFVTDTTFDGETRTVTFFNGMVARECIVSVDDDRRRLASGVVGGRFEHHNASAEIVEEPGAAGCRLVWIADLLPDDVADVIGGMMDAGIGAMKGTVDGSDRIMVWQ